VRQGGVLSQLFFPIFIGQLVDRVKAVNAGCYISTVCCSIFLYADDILLIAPIVSRIFMKIFRTGSPAVVKECQFNFNFMPIQSQISIHTAKFLNKFILSENSLCFFAANNAYQFSQTIL